MHPYRLLILVLTFCSSFPAAYGTHLLGGEINIKSNGLTCVFTLQLYTNDASDIKGGEGILDFGDGNQSTSPTLESKASGLKNISIYEYTISHTYTAYDLYKVTYIEPNLRAGILNMNNSVETRFFLEANVMLIPGGTGSQIGFGSLPIFSSPVGNQYTLSNIVEASGDYKYTYEFSAAPPMYENYKVPEQSHINSETGLITWDGKFNNNNQIGSFLFLIQVNQYDTNDNFLGFTMRSITVNLIDHESHLQISSQPADQHASILLTEGSSKVLKIIFKDLKTADSLRTQMILSNDLSGAVTLHQYDSVGQMDSLKVAVLTIDNTGIARDAPYYFALRGLSYFGNSDFFATDIAFIIHTKEVKVDPDLVTSIREEELLYGKFIYPNPFSDHFSVRGIEGITTIQILQQDGRELFNSELQNDQVVDTSQYPSGGYIILVKKPEEAFVFKGVKIGN